MAGACDVVTTDATRAASSHGAALAATDDCGRRARHAPCAPAANAAIIAATAARGCSAASARDLSSLADSFIVVVVAGVTAGVGVGTRLARCRYRCNRCRRLRRLSRTLAFALATFDVFGDVGGRQASTCGLAVHRSSSRCSGAAIARRARAGSRSCGGTLAASARRQHLSLGWPTMRGIPFSIFAVGFCFGTSGRSAALIASACAAGALFCVRGRFGVVGASFARVTSCGRHLVAIAVGDFATLSRAAASGRSGRGVGACAILADTSAADL